jgi:hypothetical protein
MIARPRRFFAPMIGLALLFAAQGPEFASMAQVPPASEGV